MVARHDGTALHKLHPLIAYERMSPVKLFINSALNIQSSPDYNRGPHRMRHWWRREGYFRIWIHELSHRVPCFRLGSLIGSSYIEKALKIDAFIMENVFKHLILTLRGLSEHVSTIFILTLRSLRQYYRLFRLISSWFQFLIDTMWKNDPVLNKISHWK